MQKCFYGSVLVALGYFGNLAPIWAKPQMIGSIRDTRDVSGSGCSIWKADQKPIFWSTDNQVALMNIDGRDRKLKLVSSYQPRRRGKLGDRWVSTYKTGKIVVVVTRTTTFVCPVGSQECEVTRYAIKIQARNGNRQEKIQANGDCGS